MRYFYDLPESSIALHPAETRGKSKFITNLNADKYEIYPHFDEAFADLFSTISEKTLIVFNDSRVVKARCAVGRIDSPDDLIELLYLHPADTDPASALSSPASGQRWRAMLRTSADVGSVFAQSHGTVRVDRVISPWIEEGEEDGIDCEVVTL